MNNNSGITLVDVRKVAMTTIAQLRDKQMDVKTAGEIRNLLGVVVDTAKTQIEFLKSIPNSVKEKMTVNEVKAIAGTLVDRDVDLDLTLNEVNESQSKPIELGK